MKRENIFITATVVLALLCSYLFYRSESMQSSYDICQGSKAGQAKADSISNANTKYLQQALDSCNSRETTKTIIQTAGKRIKN